MTMTYGARARLSQYTNEAVLSATPVRLLTMLYDRLLLDLGRAEVAQGRGDWTVAGENLLHAQAIVAELASTLKVDAWDGGESLLALYTYVTSAMVSANIHRDIERTRESITLLEPLRRTWHEAADGMSASGIPVVPTGGSLGVA